MYNACAQIRKLSQASGKIDQGIIKADVALQAKVVKDAGIPAD
jgi:hypothetical protein